MRGCRASPFHFVVVGGVTNSVNWLTPDWQITALPVFENFKMQSLFDGMNNGSGRVGFALLGYANWVHSLHKADRLVD